MLLVYTLQGIILYYKLAVNKEVYIIHKIYACIIWYDLWQLCHKIAARFNSEYIYKIDFSKPYNFVNIFLAIKFILLLQSVFY
jgi:hypothetical protein